MKSPVDFGFDNRSKRQPAIERERAVGALAAGQHGVVSAGQLRSLGFHRSAITRRLSTGRLHLLHRGVYAVGHSALTIRGRWLAAVLACGDGALLSHRDAAFLWGIRRSDRAKVEVLVMAARRSPPGLQIHRGSIHPDDVWMIDSIPVTSIARTLLDLGAVLTLAGVTAAFDEAQRLSLIDTRAIAAALDRHPNQRGAGRLRELIATDLQGVMETRSPLERRFLRLCADFGLPLPTVNAVVAGYEVDALWLRERLIVELDGTAYHRHAAARRRDRCRDAVLIAAGYRVVRLGWADVVDLRAATGERIGGLLAAG